MRKSGRWMVLLDERILEKLDEEGFQTPSELAKHEYIHYSAQHVGDRARKLAEHDLVENVGNGVYRITERGSAYLRGEINTSNEASSEENSGVTQSVTEGST
ncbi:MarR family transcriptional regulator [Salinirubellus sp. GCM10025818]|uniref:MarR family transcriptional regulator n=1 Tax=Salinirubellus TaxID=2162630 RepID=UPI0030D4F959